jgi:hypothetical protein
VGGGYLVGMGRFELPTSPTRKERSTKLSHIPTEGNRILNGSGTGSRL